MISVTISIDGKVLVHRGVVNISPDTLNNHEVHTYQSDDGSIIKHRRSDGAVALAIKILKTVREVK